MLPYRDSRITKIALAVFFVIIAGYAYFEARGMLFGPSISISGRAMLVSDPYVEIKGSTARIASLTMNGADIPVTQSGAFDQPYTLSPGYNRIVLDAKDRYGKTAERVIEIVYRPSPTSSVTTSTSTAPQQLFTPGATASPSSTTNLAH